MVFFVFFFFKQKTAYEMRISDWSSDVCSSDLVHDEALRGNVSLGAEIKRVLEVGMKISTEANTLASALKGDKKTTGNWGEMQLERTLELAGLFKGDHYQPQPRFKDAHGNDRQPDFVVKCPDRKRTEERRGGK